MANSLLSALTESTAPALTDLVYMDVGATDAKVKISTILNSALPDGCRVYHSVDQAITTGTNTALTFDSERYDNGGLHSGGAATRLTAARAGVYLITASVRFDIVGTTDKERKVYLRLNGTTTLAVDQRPAVPVGSNDYTSITITTLYKLAATDYVEVLVYHDYGTNINVMALVNASPEFAMQWMST
jgi:hypothetical protein